MGVNMEELIKFLRENKALTAYKKAYEKMKRNYDLKTFCHHASKTQYISGAFRWGDTNKNVQYWSLLNAKWLTRLGEIS